MLPASLRGMHSAARLHLRLIHARAERTTHAERERKLHRPSQNFSFPGTSTELSKGESRFVLQPTQLGGHGRTELASSWRKKLQLSVSNSELLRHLEVAFDSNEVDISVIAVAMQRCGQGRWWDALTKVRDMQQQRGPVLNCICCNVYLTALTKCLRGAHGFGAIQERQKLVLKLAQTALGELVHVEKEQQTITLNAALGLCVAASSTEALAWGEELWHWGEIHHIVRTLVTYNNFVFLLETHGSSERVDAFLADAKTFPWIPDFTSLGGLINAAAERRDWRRAEALWFKLTTSFSVKPTHIQYTARVKAHMLCGRPAAVVDIVDELLENGIQLQPQLAEAQFQALLIIYHSTLSQDIRDRLTQSGRTGAVIMPSATGDHRRTWEELQSVFTRLCNSPTSVRLTDVLVTWKSRQSEMTNWNSYPAGSNYLKQV